MDEGCFVVVCMSCNWDLNRFHYIISYIHFWNLYFFGLEKHNLSFLHAAGRNLFLVCCFDRITFLFSFLHWLPLSQSYQSKVFCHFHLGAWFLTICSSSPWTGDFGMHLPWDVNSLHLPAPEAVLNHLQTPTSFWHSPKTLLWKKLPMET